MDMLKLSPEEILRKKEINGGIDYDPDPLENQIPEFNKDNVYSGSSQLGMDYSEYQTNQSDSGKSFNDFKENDYLEDNKDIPMGEKSLGRSKLYDSRISSENGWKNIPVDVLPTRGIYYPYGTRISIRPAETKEIRHFSTIDEEDRLDIEEKISYVLERCLRIEFPNENGVSYKDLKQEDRFYLVISIRDLTFVKGENSIFLKPNKKCNKDMECPFDNGIELRTGCLDSYRIEDKIMNYYNHQTGSFIFTVRKTGKKVEMFIPSIGVTQAISSYVIEASRKKIPIDDGFLQISPFLFGEWRDLTFDLFINKMRECDYWSKEEYSILFELSKRIKTGTKMQVKQKCNVCGDTEVTADITFPGGIGSLFLISDIFRELL